MAPLRPRRSSHSVSYRESPATEDEEQTDKFEASEDASPPPPPRCRRSTRRGAPLRITPGSSRSMQTRRRPRVRYEEQSTDDEDEDEDFVPDERRAVPEVAAIERAPAIRTNPRRASGRLPRKTTKASPRKTLQRQSQIDSDSRWPKLSRRHQNVAAQPEPRGPSQPDPSFTGKPCPWTYLPFEILRDILTYASYPLLDHQGSATSHVEWLLKFRSIHPALLEASQAVLYYCPPLTSAAVAHKFLSLMTQTNPRAANYNVKVRHLKIEARNTLAYSAGVELGSFDLGALVRQLPQLTGIDVWTMLDHPDVRRASITSRSWSYPDTMFKALADVGQRLRRFHWNSRFMGKQATEDPSAMYRWMHDLHQLPAFQSLTYLKLTNFLGDSDARIDLDFAVHFSAPGKPLTAAQQKKEALRLEKKNAQHRQDELLAKAVSGLPNLRKLELHMCSIVDGDWLCLLPQGLTHLGILECDRLTSEGLEEFLNTHGQHLQVLILNHNPALSISFLSTLAKSCPALRELRMDLTYFRDLLTVDNTADPMYEHLLLPDERPTWPRTLQTISMNHLHHLSSPAAEVFFTSLIESAEELKDLRRLLLSMSLDISWRDRAKMRDVWEYRIKRVFLRNTPPPNPYWWSLGSFKQWKERKVAEVVITSQNPERHSEVTTVPVDKTDLDEDEDDDGSDMPVRNRKRTAVIVSGNTRRLRPRKTVVEEDHTDDTERLPTFGSNVRDTVMETLDRHVQGMCEEVDVRIDNIRPREEQFHENDFLTAEPSGDEEWNGVDLDDDELYYTRNGGRKPRYAW
ncbi:hypothetical protein, variant [Verruconis gallopava]|uniref:Uncharacterized protein n=1 Tax=Verruconis gallopava TaxID=253628 RepID=A0A0D1X8M3_9PEZI|nr:hypothetical protein, variant [Verruconis gallopava]KIV98365.1 hypothetical protein, variant [Verruconis gallopava]